MLLIFLYVVSPLFNVHINYIGFDAIYYMFFLFIGTIQDQAPFEVINSAFGLFILTVLMNGIGILFIWWLFDLKFIIKQMKKKRRKQTHSQIKRYIPFILWLFFGWVGAHRFYMKKYKSAVIMFIVSILLIIFNFDRFKLIFQTITSSIDPITFFINALIVLVLFFSSSMIILLIWWMIDLFYVYRFIQAYGKK